MNDEGPASRIDWILWCLAGAVAVLLDLIEKTPLMTAGLLVTLFAFLAFPVMNLPVIRRATPGASRRLSQGLGLLIVAIVVSYFGTTVWPPPPRPLRILTAKERARFVQILRSQLSPRETLRLGCPIGKEDECLLVGQFIDIFKEAGWPVEHDQVARLAPGKPQAGLALFQHADNVPKDLPYGEGVWVELTPSARTIMWAFGSVGLKTRGLGDATTPKGTIGAYFGPDL